MKLIKSLLYFIVFIGIASCKKNDNPGDTPDTASYKINQDFKGGSTNGSVTALARQSDGKIIIGGLFTVFNGEAVNHVARLNPDGTIDNSFTGSINCDGVGDIAIQSDGKILIAVNYQTLPSPSVQHNSLFRLNADGSVDNSFPAFVLSASLDLPEVNTLKILSDGRILMGGHFLNIGNTYLPSLVRLLPNGMIDQSFHFYSASYDITRKVEVISSHLFIIHADSLIKTDLDGNRDVSFHFPTYTNTVVTEGQYLNSFAVAADGKIIIAGHFYRINDTEFHGVARLNSDGSLDQSFKYSDDSAGGPYVDDVVFKNATQILVGHSINLQYGTENSLELVNADGSFDKDFKPMLDYAPTNGVHRILKEAENAYIIGGSFTRINSTDVPGVARLTF